MPRLASIAGAILLMTDYSLAQSAPDPGQCEQIRQAVAQYGYVAARRHAMVTYGPEAVKAGDKCLTKQDKMDERDLRQSQHREGTRLLGPAGRW
jgi:hypothetical protein